MSTSDELISEVERIRMTLNIRRDKIVKLELVIREFLAAYDEGQVQMSSPEIGGHDDIPRHPWHEEWLHHAREAVK